MKWHEHCRFMGLERDYSVEELAKFHGHLGPFIVLGYRMGRHALHRLGSDPFALSATVYCSGTPPESCLVDGVQIGSGCTFGKRNIDLVVSPRIWVQFRHADGRTILLKPGPYRDRAAEFDGPDRELALENFAEAISPKRKITRLKYGAPQNAD
ncbi:formylmethanofuran dehydrogenase subunit E family protein [Methanoculleus palmolei]|jgi:formylmethanofuran dehydrogenase subunit E|uniref:Formylmethanofuran dehydrogenase subunit E family protein n=1 Tax=Methanoculleus palmolei TaxID=72612 RepID=A0ABD8ACF9_9EURY|nr:formylmethanofuran dehydrogenase subunit E family protein [Methanoculleus palmolei]